MSYFTKALKLVLLSTCGTYFGQLLESSAYKNRVSNLVASI
jgi:hypothetical protein